MADHDAATESLRASLIDGLRVSRDAERELFAALDPPERDAPPADGGWSARTPTP